MADLKYFENEKNNNIRNQATKKIENKKLK